MIWSPMSEIPQIGRNPIYMSTLFAFVFLNFGVICESLQDTTPQIEGCWMVYQCLNTDRNS